MAAVLDDRELQRIYSWVDEIPLSRPKRSITRDFSDGVLMAELVHHYFPKLVEIHNYSGANSVRQKMYNWSTLNLKVFRRLGFSVDKGEIDSLVGCRPGAVELLLMRLQKHISEIRSGRRSVASPQALLEAGDAGASAAPTAPTAPAAAQQQQQQQQQVQHDFAAAAAGIAAGAPSASAAAPHAPQAAAQLHGGGGGHAAATSAVDAALLAEKDAALRDLHETVEILELKIRKLEQLVKLKDSRIQTLTARLGAAATGGGAGAPQ